MGCRGQAGCGLGRVPVRGGGAPGRQGLDRGGGEGRGEGSRGCGALRGAGEVSAARVGWTSSVGSGGDRPGGRRQRYGRGAPEALAGSGPWGRAPPGLRWALCTSARSRPCPGSRCLLVVQARLRCLEPRSAVRGCLASSPGAGLVVPAASGAARLVSATGHLCVSREPCGFFQECLQLVRVVLMACPGCYC